MKKDQTEYTMDGKFEYEGEIIYYRITDDTKPIRMVKGVEKMSRYAIMKNMDILPALLFPTEKDLRDLSST